MAALAGVEGDGLETTVAVEKGEAVGDSVGDAAGVWNEPGSGEAAGAWAPTGPAMKESPAAKDKNQSPADIFHTEVILIP